MVDCHVIRRLGAQDIDSINGKDPDSPSDSMMNNLLNSGGDGPAIHAKTSENGVEYKNVYHHTVPYTTDVSSSSVRVALEELYSIEPEDATTTAGSSSTTTAYAWYSYAVESAELSSKKTAAWRFLQQCMDPAVLDFIFTNGLYKTLNS